MTTQKDTTRFYTKLLLVFFITFGLNNVAQAALKNVTGQLKLRATIDNRPAFSAVSWEISLNKSGRQKIVKTVKQHSATIDLEPGTYRIVLSAKDKALTHSITIVESGLHDLIIDLD